MTGPPPSQQLSFATDIAPTLQQFRQYMLWRLDLTKYEDVAANALHIQGVITGTDQLAAQMPPAGWEPLPDGFVATFASWIAQNCPP